MHHAPVELIILLLASIVVVTLFKHLRLSPVLGYIVAGAIIGPSGVGIIKDFHTTEFIAEFGVIFLLFIIGLELTFEKLASMKIYVFGYGTGQVALSATVIGLGSYYIFNKSFETSLLIGFSLALSSTA